MGAFNTSQAFNPVVKKSINKKSPEVSDFYMIFRFLKFYFLHFWNQKMHYQPS